MILRSISTRSFRNLVDCAWHFHPSVNVLVGDNGQGKTNVLEAIYLLGSTKSFRTAKLQNLVRIGDQALFVEGVVASHRIDRTLSIGLAGGDERRREILLNGQKSTIHPYLQILPLQVYSSSQLEIVRGSPEWRRRFIDRGIAGVDPSHLVALTRYGKVVKQRNALLDDIRAQRSRVGQLDAWDEELIAAAHPILRARHDYVAKLSKTFAEIVSAHAYHVDDVRIAYHPAGITGKAETDRVALREKRSAEIRIGHSLVGPQRDSIEFTRKGLPAAELLSSGEIKMTVLFLSLAAMDVYFEKFESRPVFLLDDIDAELDLGILQRLLRYIIGSTQIFTTSAKEPILGTIDFGPHRRFILHRGSPTLTNDAES